MSEDLSQQEQENRRPELEDRERTKLTRFREEIRMLHLSQSIEEFYRSTSDLNQARHQAEAFLKRRLRRLFPDMPTEEATELRQQSAEIIDAIEDKILQERRDEIEEQRRRAAEAPGQRQETEEEMEMGGQTGRVEMRVAGSYRRVPQKIMPDPDAPASFVLAAHDPQTGKLVPQRRRGRTRQVEKGEDGVWRLVESDTAQNEESDMADILSQEEIDAQLIEKVLSASEGDKPSNDEYVLLVRWLRDKLELQSEALRNSLQQAFTIFDSDADSEQVSEQIAELLLAQAREKKFTEEQLEALRPEIGVLLDRMVEARMLRQMGAQPDEEGRIVTSYDFKHPARVNKDQLRTLENLHDNFARLLSSTFSGAMRAVVDVDTAFVDQTTYDEFVMSLSNPSCSYQFTLGETGGQAIIDFAMPVVFAFVDRIFGGKGSSQGVSARVVTPVEIGVINRIVKRVIEDIEATWEPILPVEITDIELETNPEFMKITAGSEIVILLAFEVNSTNASGLVSLCYPFFTLEPIMPLLGQQTYGRGHERRLPKRRERLGDLPLDVMGPTPIPLNVEMGQARMPLSKASVLKVGDVVTMDTRTSDPCVMYVGDKPKYYVQPFAEDGKMHAEITGLFPRELYNKRGIS